MKPTAIVMLAAGALAISACARENSDPSNIADQISGKTLVASDRIITANDDRTLTGVVNGEEVAGQWEVRDGFWCRTFDAPASVAGTDCFTVAFSGGRMTAIPNSGEGDPLVFEIQEISAV